MTSDASWMLRYEAAIRASEHLTLLRRPKGSLSRSLTLETSRVPHAVIQRDFPAVPEGRMAQIVTESRRLDKAQRRNMRVRWVRCVYAVELPGDAARDLRDFE